MPIAAQEQGGGSWGATTTLAYDRDCFGGAEVTPRGDQGLCTGMSLWLLKFSGGSVDDYAICRSS
jgi:hypothetical protein